MARLSRGALNRTLLHRQQLLRRARRTPVELARHLVGLHASDPADPYLGMAARVVDPDPGAMTQDVLDRRLVRTFSLRGAWHLHDADDALSLPRWLAPVREREARASSAVGAAYGIDRGALERAVRDLTHDEPLPFAALGAALAEAFPGHEPARLGHLALTVIPMVQVPPRGAWDGTGEGSVTYQATDRWLGSPLRDPDVPGVVRRFLRSHGPSSTADLATWSGISRLAPVVSSMPDLQRHVDEGGRTLHDVADGSLVSADHPGPTRLLGCCDNLWLSHAGRDRVTTSERRARWLSPVAGTPVNAVLVDGWVEGFWTLEGSRVGRLDLQRTLTRFEQGQVDEEVDRTNAFLAR